MLVTRPARAFRSFHRVTVASPQATTDLRIDRVGEAGAREWAEVYCAGFGSASGPHEVGVRVMSAETWAEGPGEHNPSLHNMRGAGFQDDYQRQNWIWHRPD